MPHGKTSSTLTKIEPVIITRDYGISNDVDSLVPRISAVRLSEA
jgi:hypothetical protein